MTTRTWSTLGTIAIALALLASPSLAGKGGGKGKPGGGEEDPPTNADPRIVYEKNDGTYGNPWIIETCDADGGNPTFVLRMDDTVGVAARNPTWSPDATRIAAGTSTTTVMPRDVIVYDLTSDGTKTVRDATETPVDATANTVLEGARVTEMSWSPSGNVLAVSVNDEYDSLHDDIWTLDLDDGATDNLTATTGNDEREPCWSPDGTRIVFRYVGYGKNAKKTGLYLMNDDGSGKTSLGPSEARAPDWR